MNFVFDQEKNQKLFEQRGVTFEQIIELIIEDKVLFDTAHPNSEKYPNQRIMIIEINGYAYAVPYVKNENELVLKTIYPDRRYKKLLEAKDEK